MRWYIFSIICKKQSPRGDGLEYLHRSPASPRTYLLNPFLLYPTVSGLRVLEGDENGTRCPGDISTETWSSRLGVGRKADDLALQKKKKKKNYCCEIDRSENRMV
jgi:hypothetical protein